jgi:hypothetical protein
MRQLRLNGDPRPAKYTENQRKAYGAKKDAKLRSRASEKFIKAPSITKWKEISRYIAVGKDTGHIAIYLNMPEWIVKILVQHIDMTNAGQGTAAQNLEAANKAIKTIKIKGKQ